MELSNPTCCQSNLRNHGINLNWNRNTTASSECVLPNDSSSSDKGAADTTTIPNQMREIDNKERGGIFSDPFAVRRPFPMRFSCGNGS
jgi:hypothetical protein